MSRQLAALATLRADVEATLSCLAVDVPNECGGGGDGKGSANGTIKSSSGGFAALRARLEAVADDCDRLRAAAAIVGADIAENRPGSSSSSLFFGRGRSVSPADLEYYEAVEAAAYALDDRILELQAALRRVVAAEEDFASDLGSVPAAIAALQSAAQSFVVRGGKP
jgi:hypothetical protein